MGKEYSIKTVTKIQHLWAKWFYYQSYSKYHVITKLIDELTTYGWVNPSLTQVTKYVTSRSINESSTCGWVNLKPIQVTKYLSNKQITLSDLQVTHYSVETCLTNKALSRDK